MALLFKSKFRCLKRKLHTKKKMSPKGTSPTSSKSEWTNESFVQQISR
jgi:hypothetical protein